LFASSTRAPANSATASSTPSVDVSTSIAPVCTDAMRVAGNMQTFLSVAGGPDDLAVIQDTVYVSLIKAGKVIAISPQGAVRDVAHGLAMNEGIAPAGANALYVVEQTPNRIDRVVNGQITPLKNFSKPAGKAGLDSIRVEDNGSILVPDSPGGRLLELNPATGAVRVLVTGLGRPVDAMRFGDGYAIADESLGLVLTGPASAGPIGWHSRFASVGEADDLGAAGDGRLLLTSLDHHSVWLYSGGRVLEIARGFQSPQGLASRGDGSWLVSDEDAGAVKVLPAECVAD
jgi:hypothetical protein